MTGEGKGRRRMKPHPLVVRVRNVDVGAGSGDRRVGERRNLRIYLELISSCVDRGLFADPFTSTRPFAGDVIDYT